MTFYPPWHSRTGKTVIAALCCLVLLAIAAPLRAQEDIDEEEPIPASVDEIVAPMDRLVEKEASAARFLSLDEGKTQGYSAIFAGHCASSQSALVLFTAQQ